MAARSKTDIVKEAQGIAKKFGIQVVGGEHAGEAGGASDDVTLTWEQAMLRLQLLQIEILSNIRQSEVNP